MPFGAKGGGDGDADGHAAAVTLDKNGFTTWMPEQVKACVPLAERVAVAGLTTTEMGVSVTVAVAVFVVSVLLVAVMVALAADTGVGAV